MSRDFSKTGAAVATQKATAETLRRSRSLAIFAREHGWEKSRYLGDECFYKGDRRLGLNTYEGTLISATVHYWPDGVPTCAAYRLDVSQIRDYLADPCDCHSPDVWDAIPSPGCRFHDAKGDK